MTDRIVYVIPTLVRGGAEKQLTLLATHLPRNQFDVHVCVLTHSGPLAATLQRANIPIHVLNKRWKVDPVAYRKLRRLVSHLNPDLVHTWIFAANCYGRLAARRAGVTCVVAGERCVDRWKSWHELAIDRCFARRTDRIVTNSSGVVEFYAEHGIPSEQFEVIPNGVELPPAEKTVEPLPGSNDNPRQNTSVPLSRADLLAQLELPENVQLIGAVGRLWPQKNYKDLIWAAELLKVVHEDSHLLIVGDGPQRMQLLRWRDSLKIQDRVHFLGEREDLASLLPHLAVFWIGSFYEGQSNAVMEAMSYALPVVASDIPGNRDLVVDQQTGYLFPVGDRAALARLTHDLLDNPQRARTMGAAGRARVAKHFSVQQMVDRHVALYQRLLHS